MRLRQAISSALGVALATCCLGAFGPAALAQTAPSTQCVASATAGGTVDAITIPALPCALTTNLLILASGGQNLTTTPTLAPLGLAPQVIVRPNGLPLALGDLGPAGYRALLNPNGVVWYLLNPATLGNTALVPGTTTLAPSMNGGVLWDNGGVLADSLVPINTALATALPSLITSQLYGGTGAAGAAQHFPAAAGIETWLQTPSSANLAAAVTDETGTGVLVFANSPVFVTPNIDAATGKSIGLTPTAASLTPGVTVTQSGPTSGTTATMTNFNSIIVAGDANANTSLSAGDNAMYIGMTYGGANSKGAKTALWAQSELTAASNGADASPNYNAIVAAQYAWVNDGGTNTGAGAKGSQEGINIYSLLLGTATNYLQTVGMEVDVGIATGASAQARLGVAVNAYEPVAGATTDAAYETLATPGSAPWVDAFLLSNAGGAAPVATTGCVICTDGSADTITTGMDLSSYTISGDFLTGPGGFHVRGSGNVLLAPSAASPAVSVSAPTTSYSAYVNFDVAGTITWQEYLSFASSSWQWGLWDIGGAATIINTVPGTASGANGIIGIGEGASGKIVLNSPVYGAGNKLVDSWAAPAISSGCGGGSPSISAPNGTVAFEVTIGTASGSTCVLTMPTATTAWNCFAEDITTHTAANSRVAQTAGTTNSVTVTDYSDLTGAATWVSGDKIRFMCRAY